MENFNKNKTDNQDIFDEIGPWTEVKLDIIKRYGQEYSRILSKREYLHHAYIDAFSGPGINKRKITKEFIPGSPLNALLIKPKFEHYYFIDIDSQKTSFLKELVGDRGDVTIYESDCNEVLLNKIFPKFTFESYWRALCFLDPYKLQLRWKVVEEAAKLGTIDLFLNFPLLDINRSVVRSNPKDITQKNIKRMDQFWGDNRWYDLLYASSPDLFVEGREQRKAKAETALVQAYRKKLLDAGFSCVPIPLPIRNTQRGIIYFIFFASEKPVAKNIVEHIFKKWGKT